MYWYDVTSSIQMKSDDADETCTFVDLLQKLPIHHSSLNYKY